MEFRNSVGVPYAFGKKLLFASRLKIFVNFDQLLQMSLEGLFFWKSSTDSATKVTNLSTEKL